MRCEPVIRWSIAVALCIGATNTSGQTPQPPPAGKTPPAGQATTPPKPAPAGTAGRPRPAPDARLSLTVMVTAPDGKTLPGITVRATGPVDRTAETDPSGMVTLANMLPGTYRLHFQGEQFIPFEREAVIAPGKPIRLSVTLTPAPPPPPAPKPEPVAPPPAPAVPDGNFSVSAASIPDLVEKNYIGGAPVKRAPVGCAAAATSTLVQTRDPIAEHTHADADETIYVVAGEGTHKAAGRENAVEAGSFLVVPRGTAHSLTRRGSRPLIFVSTLAGPPCQAGK